MLLSYSDPLLRLDDRAIDRILRRVSSKVFDVADEIDPDLFEHTFGALRRAIDKGFGQVGYDSPDFEFVNELRHNAASFSAFKTHRQQNELFQQIFKEDGTVKSFAQFRRDSEQIIGNYNTNWLQTEYSTAVIRARNAVKWREFERDADLYPNLKWLPSTSADPREAHRVFYGKIWPMTAPFWVTNYPGSIWGCKCGITSTDEPPTDAKATRRAIKTAPKAAPGLDTNPGKTGALFSLDTHPYCTKCIGKRRDVVRLANTTADKVMMNFTANAVKEFKTTIDMYKGLDINAKNLLTGSVKVTRGCFKDIKTHNVDYRVLSHLLNPKKAIESWEYIGIKSVGVYPRSHKLQGKRKHQDTDYFVYYKTEIGGKIRYIHTKFHTKFKMEVPYVITDDLDMKGMKKRDALKR